MKGTEQKNVRTVGRKWNMETNVWMTVKNISHFFSNLSGTRSIQQKKIEMAHDERCTKGRKGREDTKRFIENSRERRCSVTKDETCNNRGICSFSLSCSFTQRLPTVGLVASARAPLKISPIFSPVQLVRRRHHRHHHPLQSPFPPVTMLMVSLSPVLEFRSCSCRIPSRTNLNKRLLCGGVKLHGHSNHRWRLPSLKQAGAMSRQFEIPFRDFTKNVGPSLTPGCVFS